MWWSFLSAEFFPSLNHVQNTIHFKISYHFYVSLSLYSALSACPVLSASAESKEKIHLIESRKLVNFVALPPDLRKSNVARIAQKGYQVTTLQIKTDQPLNIFRGSGVDQLDLPAVYG